MQAATYLAYFNFHLLNVHNWMMHVAAIAIIVLDWTSPPCVYSIYCLFPLNLIWQWTKPAGIPMQTHLHVAYMHCTYKQNVQDVFDFWHQPPGDRWPRASELTHSDCTDWVGYAAVKCVYMLVAPLISHCTQSCLQTAVPLAKVQGLLRSC